MIENYCLLTGSRCSHYPINIEPNLFFISEPYDKERKPREKAVKEAIKGYPNIIADHKTMNIALTCKICQQIQSAQFGIVDITGLNENVLIELGMLYGFFKPVVVLVKHSEKTKINIPSNIVGIEQVRYKDFDDLTKKLRKLLTSLFELWKKKGEYLINLKPMLEAQIIQLQLAIQTKNLLDAKFEGIILDFKIIDSIAIAIVNKGTGQGVRKGMLFKVYRCDKKVKGVYLEEDVGLLIVRHPQEKISQCQPVSIDPDNPFWRDAFSRTSPPRNIVKPYLVEPYERIAMDEMKDMLNKLKILHKGIYLGRGA